MRTQSIRSALTAQDDIIPGYVYVIRDGEVIFYVGISGDPQFRLAQHLGLADSHNRYFTPVEAFIKRMETGKSEMLDAFRLGASPVGDCIIDNAPTSLDWLFDIYEKEDALAVLDHAGMLTQFPHLHKMMEINWYEQRSLVETNLIDQLRPCLNRMGATHYSNPIPEKYVRTKIANEGVKITE
jgi:hypothetical protein